MKAYVISLPRSARRRASIAEQLARTALEFDFVDGVDGRGLTAAERAELVSESAVARYTRWLTPEQHDRLRRPRVGPSAGHRLYHEASDERDGRRGGTVSGRACSRPSGGDRGLRRAVRRLNRLLEPAGRRLGTRLLASPRMRTALNTAYERSGPLIARLVTRFFSGSTVTTPFIWRARLPSGVLRVPVMPELQRSWTNALVWRWPPNLPMRHLYEAYTVCRGARGVLLDVGANDGSHSWLFSLAEWRCIAFEPQPDCVAYLRRIAALNGFGELVVEQCAVGDRQARAVDFYVSQSSWFSSLERDNVERYEPRSGPR